MLCWACGWLLSNMRHPQISLACTWTNAWTMDSSYIARIWSPKCRKLTAFDLLTHIKSNTHTHDYPSPTQALHCFIQPRLNRIARYQLCSLCFCRPWRRHLATSCTTAPVPGTLQRQCEGQSKDLENGVGRPFAIKLRFQVGHRAAELKLSMTAMSSFPHDGTTAKP